MCVQVDFGLVRPAHTFKIMIKGVDEMMDSNAAKPQEPQRLRPEMALDQPKLAILAEAFERHADFVVGQKRIRPPPDGDKPG